MHRAPRHVAVAALALFALAGCAGSPTEAAAPNSPPVSPTTSPGSTLRSSEPVSVETIAVCRGLAEDEDLKAFWSWVNAGGQGPDERQPDALRAVERVAKLTARTSVDKAVSSTLRSAASGSAAMRAEWVRSGNLDVERFRDLITPVVEACEAQDVDMSVG